MHIPEGYSQVNLKFTGTGVPTGAEVTFGVRHDAGPQFPTDIATNVYTALFNANMDDLYTTDATISSIYVKNGPNVDGPFAEVSGSYVGADGNDSATPAVATLIRKNTSFGGRAGRGRMYWPCPAAGRMDDSGIVTAAFITIVNDRMDAFRSQLEGVDLTMVLLHGGSLPPPYVVTSTACDGRAATQRRRQRRS